MSSKKKVAISLTIAISVFLIAVITLVAVFAATSQTVKTSSIKVVYQASKNVVGSMSANYKLQGDTEYKAMTTDGKSVNEEGTNAFVTFNFDDDKKSQTLQIQESDLKPSVENGVADSVDLEGNVRWIVFEFKFENSGSHNYTASIMESETTKTNMVVEYATSYSDMDSDWDSNPDATSIVVPAGTLDDETGKVTSSKATYYVRIRVQDSAHNAGFAGTFIWNLQAE